MRVNFVLITSLVVVLMIVGCTKFHWFEENVTAEILSVNDSITNGELIGSFLSIPSGKFRDDINKIGVRFILHGRAFYRDLNVLHSEISALRDRSDMRLYVVYRVGGDSVKGAVSIREIWFEERRLF